MTAVRQSSRESVPEMKMRAETLRSAREKERKAMADEKLYQHWITNDPDLRSIEQQKLENIQPEYWSGQINERRVARAEEEEQDLLYQEELRLRMDEEEKLEIEQQNERKRRIDQLKMILQQQMDELREKEEEVCFFSSSSSYLMNQCDSIESTMTNYYFQRLNVNQTIIFL